MTETSVINSWLREQNCLFLEARSNRCDKRLLTSSYTSVHTYQRGPRRKKFRKIWYWWKYIKKVQI